MVEGRVVLITLLASVHLYVGGEVRVKSMRQGMYKHAQTRRESTDMPFLPDQCAELFAGQSDGSARVGLREGWRERAECWRPGITLLASVSLYVVGQDWVKTNGRYAQTRADAQREAHGIPS